MLLIRRFEEKVEERFRAGELPGFLHVAIGQEAVASGVCAALEPDDVIASTHRAHGHTLAKGTHVNAVMAELYGKQEGCSRGFGGSMHLYDVERGNLGANAVVGGGLPADRRRRARVQVPQGEPRVAVAFFGDGATNTGTFHESLNLAQLWKVPALFVLENNGWAESTPRVAALPPIEDISAARRRYGMRVDRGRRPGRRGGLRGDARGARARALRPGPRLPERPDLPARRPLHRRPAGLPREGRDRGAARDARIRSSCCARGSRSRDEEFEALDTEVTAIVEESVEFAKAGTDPPPEDALKYVYA